MASGTSPQVKTSHQWTYVWFTWSAVSNGSTANSSTVTVNIYGSRVKNDGYTSYGAGSYTASVAGQTLSGTFSSKSIGSTSAVLMGTLTFTVPHNADGTWSGTISGGWTINDVTSGSSSTGAVFDTIPRKSSVNNASGNIGSAVNVTINSNSTSFRHNVRIIYGSVSTTVLSNVAGGTFAFTPDMSWCNQTPTNVTGQGTIYVDTYSSGSLIGTSSAILTLYVPASVVPTAEELVITKEDTVVPTDWGIYVKNKSKIKAVVNGASGAYGSTISSITLTFCNLTKTGAEIVFDCTLAGAQDVVAVITDSRNRKTTLQARVDIIDYNPPKITEALTKRCLSDGTDNEDGTYAKCNAIFDFSDCSGHNTLTKQVQYKVKGAQDWSAPVDYTNDCVIGDGNISTEATYDIRYVATDYFGPQYYTDFISIAFCTQEYLDGGHGVSFGKVAELLDTLDVAFKALFRNKTNMLDTLSFGNDTSVFNVPVMFYASANNYYTMCTQDGSVRLQNYAKDKSGNYVQSGTDIKINTNGEVFFDTHGKFGTDANSVYMENPLGQTTLSIQDDGSIGFFRTVDGVRTRLLTVYKSTGSFELPHGGYYFTNGGVDWDPGKSIARLVNTSNGGWMGIGGSGIPVANGIRMVCSKDSTVAYLQNIDNSYLQIITTAATFGIYYNVSDTKLKKNITSFTSDGATRGLELIKNIPLVSYDLRDTGKHVPLGLSANNLEKLNPELIFKVPQSEDSPYYSEKDPYIRQINLYTLTAELILAIKEQSNIVTDLQKEVEVLKKIVNGKEG